MKPQEFIDKWFGWVKNKEEINDEILADLNVINKALSTPIVRKSFTLGKEARIIECFNGHKFKYGELVEIVEKFDNNLWIAKSKTTGEEWYITEKEANLKEKVKKLEFMIENGLGEEDIVNDITYPSGD